LSTTIEYATFIHLMTPYDRGCPSLGDTGNSVAGYCNVDPSMLGSTPGIPLLDVLDETKYK
jgi:hypothetical protein